MLVISFC